MCLGVPGQVIAVHNKLATVDFWGVRRPVQLDALEELVFPGDYIINHCGHAVRKVPAEMIADTLGMYEVILSEAGEDPMVSDVVRDLESASELEFEIEELEPVLA
jgi:hydrogenase assembly chaperone HypC/HupF